jgi:drug/metabolite transporter (DMT)-like permease
MPAGEATARQTAETQPAHAHRNIALLKALFAVIVWGGSFIATKVALADVSPVTIIWVRFTIGVAVLGWVVAIRRELARVGSGDLLYFTLLGFLGIALHQWLQSTGLVTSEAGTTAWIVASAPIFIAMLGYLVLGERVGWTLAAGIGLAASGVLIVASKGDWRALGAGRFGNPGDILILISSVNWAVFSVLSRRGLRRHPPSRMMFYIMTIGWILITVLFAAGPGFTEISRLTPPGWAAILFLGVLCSGIAYVFWFDALHAMPASQVGVLLYLEPLVTVAVARVLLGEPILVATLAGGAMILTGVWLVNRRTALPQTTKHGRRSPRPPGSGGAG